MASSSSEHTPTSITPTGHDSTSSGCFFADATLDLAEAQDIAETPEPRKVLLDRTAVAKELSIELPTFSKQNKRYQTIPLTTTGDDHDGGEDDRSQTQDGTRSRRGSGSSMGVTNKSTTATASMSRITSADIPHNLITAPTSNSPISSTYFTRISTNRPRDITWAIAFLLFVPFSLVWPIVQSRNQESPSSSGSTASPTYWMAWSQPSRWATLQSFFFSYAATVVLARLLYKSHGGGDGENARHAASQMILSFAPISVAVYVAMIVALYWFTPGAALPFVMIPLWYLIRDLYLFRRWQSTATTPDSRQAFFQALTCMALDVLSRSLRRSSFYRMVSILLTVQLGVVLLWQWALLASLQQRPSALTGLMLLAVLIGGKWATGVIARLLSLIASGGITSWFAHQSALILDFERQRQQEHGDTSNPTDDVNDNNGHNAKSFGSTNIQEAYRTVDASVYQSVLDLDDGLDDDFDDEEGAEESPLTPPPGRRESLGADSNYSNQNKRGTTNLRSQGRNNTIASTTNTSARDYLVAGLTVSFGSVAHCGLLGGFAQFVWSSLRKIEAASATRSAYNARGSGGGGGFRGMRVGSDSASGDNSGGSTVVVKLWNQTIVAARNFVRGHSDLAMTHVAAFRKSYHKASLDVSALVDQSGVEPIMNDDITTHMCACVGGSISGIVVIVTAFLVTRDKSSLNVSDVTIAENMLLTFVFCYTLIFTVMEPLRASIKATYVCFAEHPRGLSQAFPLIFHRLTRISEENMS